MNDSAARRIGKFDVTAVSDGVIKAPADIVLGLESAAARRLTAADADGAIHMPVNVFLVAFDGALALLDTGASDTLGPGTGKLVGNLRAHGVDPAAIDYIFLTHLDPDHSNGLVDSAGRPCYPNARVFVREEDARFWLDREVTPDVPERLRRRMHWAQRAAGPYGERLHRVGEGEVLPGISTVLSAGHTPGHSAWLFRSGGDAFVGWGDTVHVPGVQVPRPEIGVVFDIDPAAAAAARMRMFELVARERTLIAGAHLDAPGFGYLVAEGGGYRLEPA